MALRQVNRVKIAAGSPRARNTQILANLGQKFADSIREWILRLLDQKISYVFVIIVTFTREACFNLPPGAMGMILIFFFLLF